ncbi:MAG: thermonuclease family protein [Hyphomicrobium sp.]
MRARQGPDTRKIWQWAGLACLAIIVGVLERNGYGRSGGDGQRPRSSQTIPASGVVEGHPKLVDGDSFYLNGTEVRMLGIDAPEGRQTCERQGRSWPCGEDARRHLALFIGGRSISCRGDEPDQHGRMLGTCTVNGRNLNRDMVTSGFAVSFGALYNREEREARDARRGLWSGQFQKPQDWRHAHGIGGPR